MLIFSSTTQVIMNDFAISQVIVFIVSILALGILTKWYVALLMSAIGVFLSVEFLKLNIGIDNLPSNISTIKFQLIYVLFLTSSVLIVFMRPKQEQITATEARAENLASKVTTLEKEKDYFRREFENLSTGIDYLDNYFTNKEAQHIERTKYLKDKINLMSIEIEKLQDMKDEFLRNIPHESNAPLTGILSLSDALYASYDSLDKVKIKDSIKTIVNSGDRLKTYIHNMIDLSKLTTLSYELDKEQINLSQLVKERPYLYKKIFSDDKKQEFKFDVEDDIVINADKYFITQAIDNLVSNAVNYGEGKEITISLKKIDDEVQFKIIDQGVGIPENELYSIFNKFVTSSRTKTPAGGRGIGLALVQKIIEAHKGKIWAENNELHNREQGATFQFVMPS